MSSNTHASAPEIFDPALRAQRLARAERRMVRDGVAFFLDRCLDDVSGRIEAVNRQFDDAVLIGPERLLTDLQNRLAAKKRPKDFTAFRDSGALYSTAQFDLALSLLSLQSVNDLPGQLIQIRRKLKPDGLFIGAIMGGASLDGFRQALYQTDEQVLGQITPRLHPRVTYEQLAMLLTRAGFNLPVVDIDRFTVAYSGIDRLIHDLRDCGATNVLREQDKRVLTRSYYQALRDNYARIAAREDGKLVAEFEILWMTGWTPHDSQQKPLKPGSAKMRLADALGAKEKKL